jgi:hypothetical protein
LSEIVQLGGRIETGGMITLPNNTTTTFVGMDDVIKEWWNGLLRDLGVVADIGLGFVPVVETLYDAFCAVSGYSLSGKLTDFEKALVVGALLAPVPGASGGTAKGVKNVVSELLHNHHLLPKEHKQAFLKAGFSKEDLEKLTTALPIDLHMKKPNGLHTAVINWNKQWKEFIRDLPPDRFKKVYFLNHLERMVKTYEGTHFTTEQVEYIMKVIDEVR